MIIKVVGARRKNPNRCGYAYEAINLQGDLISSGGASCAADSVLGAVQKAIMEASIKATTLGNRQILVPSDCKRLVQVSNGKNSPKWKEKIMLTDLHSLSQNGLVFQSFLYQLPRIILCKVATLAEQATRMPTNHCWINPTFL